MRCKKGWLCIRHALNKVNDIPDKIVKNWSIQNVCEALPLKEEGMMDEEIRHMIVWLNKEGNNDHDQRFTKWYRDQENHLDDCKSSSQIGFIKSFN